MPIRPNRVLGSVEFVGRVALGGESLAADGAITGQSTKAGGLTELFGTH